MAWASECKATQRDVSYLQISQGEADAKMILHVLDAASNGATEINVFSPDTELFVDITNSVQKSPLSLEQVSAVE